MNRKLIASLMLGAVIGLSGAAQAENMIKGINVTAEDWPKVQEKCTALAAANATEQQKAGTQSSDSNSDSTTNGGTDGGTTGGTDNGQSANNDSQGTSDQVGSEVNAQLAKSIDLDTVVYQDCVDAGLVTNP